ncbi:MAG: pyruvate:ferredoxin (flavodoxin) oxidoreductase [candidate division KSB1 bacterium]|nr:pyruvate:ferredoxin (flavodoxin) oxidoreductase [candidate division KSB1 bacterium]MDZ7367593.1 pyruvate:ferredoxin (flavodoxin) oxidoreductase [candidate division KSB1 bacterium]MDZ7405385.1 pyruvate:ferredoxin (flavodoxin) oxidoreductase [candidate division KSB1 bacterium]
MNRRMVTLDGNEAAAYVAHKTNEVIAIYPITPSSPMGEWADAWSAVGEKNIWGTTPVVTEMQSEGGAAGAVHGALQTGGLTTTFTSSQGLMLMIPNMYKIAGELTPTVFHVAARSLAAQALSIFGDHSDVMAVRSTGFAMLASASVQEVMDFALIAQAATLESRVPFLHFFDGFRTSHEVNKIEQLTEADMAAMLDDELVRAHRRRALSPDQPVLRGSAQNPDVYFQGREAVNRFYLACPEIVQKVMNKFASLTGRQYKLFDYIGAPDAERIIVLMGSGAEAVQETVDHLVRRGEKVGVVKVRLYRPFSIEHFVSVLPPTVKTIAALDRTKEPGGLGEPLYLDVVAAVNETMTNASGSLKLSPRLIGGRYGLSSKEFTPAMIKSIFDEMKKAAPKNHFTVGINDDVTMTSLEYDPNFSTEPDDVIRAMFYGLGADGTVGANKNSIKIIGEDTPNYAQGYFVYDSKKSGSVTVSHLRFGPRPIHSTYLVKQANFIGCHQFNFVEKFDMLPNLVEGGTFLLNSPYGPEEVWDHLPRQLQEQLIAKQAKFYVIDGYTVAKETGMGARMNTIMQTCFFAISGVLPRQEAIAKIKETIKKTYGAKGDEIVQMNYRAVDQTLEHLYEVKVPDKVTSTFDRPDVVAEGAPDFVKNFTAKIIAGYGDDVPVSAMPVDGTFPTATAMWEKRAIALEIPIWDKEICIQCNKCALVCPHAAIRVKVYEERELANAPATFEFMEARDREWKGMKYTVQVAPEDCTGCGICVEICPAKNKRETRLKAINMQPLVEHRERERVNFDFFLKIPELDRRKIKINSVKGSQLLQPLFEFSGACAGCGETPYVKLVSQLFGDRAVIANATGCSSIYGGNLPTTPWAKNPEGRGPAWSNSLFEDNAEFGFGFRLTIDKQKEQAEELLRLLEPELGRETVQTLLNADQSDEAGIYEQRERVERLKEKLARMSSGVAKNLLSLADYLVKKSVWIIGGDGWAYDIGYGGLDHVLASGKNVNILVLDTEVYSNTGGQMSKATPRGAVAKFAAGGKPRPKKDLAMLAMSYGHVYVARVAMGANDTQTVQAFIEAEQYDGPSLIIAYSHCIAHGINMTKGMEQQKLAVNSGYWPMFRYNPKLAEEGKSPLHLDSRPPSIPLKEYMYRETRFKMLTKSNPVEAERLLRLAQQDVQSRWRLYEHLAVFGASNKE